MLLYGGVVHKISPFFTLYLICSTEGRSHITYGRALHITIAN